MQAVTVHRRFVRIFHWLNAIAMVMMISSGWRIYNASPLFDFRFPNNFTLGGWLGGALLWHFAAMWLFVINLLIYLMLGFVTGHFRMRFFPISPREVFNDFLQALRGRLAHEGHGYNGVQKLFYVGVIAAMLLTFASGLVVWKQVQFQALSVIFGNYESARLWHFAGMSLICAFIVVHLALVALVPSTLRPMITGKAKSNQTGGAHVSQA